MIIKKIRLNNFMSYYGHHLLELDKGINYIIGHCGSGRTNLARAIQFAVLGSGEFQRKSLINSFHLDECFERDEGSSCEVEVSIEIGEKEYLCRSKATVNEKTQINQYSSIPLEVDNIINPESYKLIYLSRHSLFDEAEREHSDAPLSDGIRNALFERLNMNVAARIRMAILDQVFDHFTYEQRKNVQQYLAELPMEQIIIIHSGEPELQNQHKYKLHRVGEYHDAEKRTSRIEKPPTWEEKTTTINDSEQKPILKQTSILKSDLEVAAKWLRLQIQKVNEENNRLSQSIEQIHKATTESRAKKDFARANVYGCLLAEKITVLKKIVQMRIALEKTAENIIDVREPVETLDRIAASVEALQKVRTMIQCPMPAVELKLQEVEFLLDHTVKTAVREKGLTINAEAAKQNAEEIMINALKEAETEIEAKLSGTFAQRLKLFGKEP